MEIDFTQIVVTVVSIFSIVYAVIGMKKTGVTVFLLQIQTPISLVKRLLRLGGGRQDFLVGRTSQSPDTVFGKLVILGYQWDYFASNDDGEEISMRKLYGNRQVHVRMFNDGEVRIHDEVNYEFEPVGHLRIPPVPASQTWVVEVLQTLEASPIPAP